MGKVFRIIGASIVLALILFCQNLVTPTLAASTLGITNKGTLPAGTLGSNYAQSVIATGGTKPYKWSVTSGSLPKGLILNPSGLVDGKATAAEPKFTASVKDTSSPVQTKSITISLTINPPTLAITNTGTLPAGTLGSNMHNR